jgi:hypothetical protein
VRNHRSAPAVRMSKFFIIDRVGYAYPILLKLLAL